MRRIARASLLAAAALAAPASALMLARGDIVIVNDTTNAVMRVNPATGAAQTLSSSTGVVLGDIAFTSDGTLFAVADAGVYRIDPVNGGARTLLTAPGQQFGASARLATSPDGRLFVLRKSNNSLVRVDRSSGAITPVATGGAVPSAIAIAFEPSTDSVLCVGVSSLVRINSVTGAQSAINATSAFIGSPPTDIAIALDGSILICRSADTVARINPATGAGAVFIPTAGSSVVFPYGVVLEPNGAVILSGEAAAGGATALARYLAGGGPESMLVYALPGFQSVSSSMAVYNPTPCPADANGDHVVDFIDLNAVLSAFGQPCP